MTTQYSTLPALIEQSSLETIAWSVDTTALGGSPTAPNSVFVDETNGAIISLSDPATVSGNLVVQIIRGTVLSVGSTYRLSFLYTIGGNVLDSEVRLMCPD